MKPHVYCAALIMAASSLSFAQGNNSRRPAPDVALPAPLLVIDSAGKVAGRYAGAYMQGAIQLQFVAISVNGVLTMAPLAVDTASNALVWAPSIRTTLYYSTSDCSGPPLVTASAPMPYPGVRPAVIDLRGTSRVLYLGANVTPSVQQAPSARSWDVGSVQTPFNSSSCNTQGFQVLAVPTESTLELDTAFPSPLKLQ